MSGHCRSRRFSLIGRRVILNDPVCGCKDAMIIEKPMRGMWFRVEVDCGDHKVDFLCPRCLFTLPPLPREQRQPEWLLDSYDGFVYEGVEGF